MRCLQGCHNVNCDFDLCDKGKDAETSASRTCAWVGMRVCWWIHLYPQHVPDMSRCPVWNQMSYSPTLFPLPLFLSSVIFLSTDNMVDQIKVETSEAKATELEKKVTFA